MGIGPADTKSQSRVAAMIARAASAKRGTYALCLVFVVGLNLIELGRLRYFDPPVHGGVVVFLDMIALAASASFLWMRTYMAANIALYVALFGFLAYCELHFNLATNRIPGFWDTYDFVLFIPLLTIHMVAVALGILVQVLQILFESSKM